VYPLFEGLARKWTEADEVAKHVDALVNILTELQAFEVPTYTLQLTAAMYDATRKTAAALTAAMYDATRKAAAAVEEQKRSEVAASGGVDATGGDPSEGKMVQGEQLVAALQPESDEPVHVAALQPESDEPVHVAALQPESDEPVHVFRAQNPEIGSIKVQLSGYCPVTITHRQGLLLPGDPSNGNVLYKYQYQNQNQKKKKELEQRLHQEGLLLPGDPSNGNVLYKEKVRVVLFPPSLLA
ncbi:hypothetical protein T484DRAFT_1817233, partial [Baffinella frigidus]